MQKSEAKWSLGRRCLEHAVHFAAWCAFGLLCFAMIVAVGTSSFRLAMLLSLALTALLASVAVRAMYSLRPMKNLNYAKPIVLWLVILTLVALSLLTACLFWRSAGDAHESWPEPEVKDAALAVHAGTTLGKKFPGWNCQIVLMLNNSAGAREMVSLMADLFVQAGGREAKLFVPANSEPMDGQLSRLLNGVGNETSRGLIILLLASPGSRQNALLASLPLRPDNRVKFALVSPYAPAPGWVPASLLKIETFSYVIWPRTMGINLDKRDLETFDALLAGPRCELLDHADKASKAALAWYDELVKP